MNVLLISTYELGRQPFGLASPAAWLRRAGADVTCVDLSREPLSASSISDAHVVAFFLPMHTAARLALSVITRVRDLNPSAHVCCYGLYAPLNAPLLKSLGVKTIIGGEYEGELTRVVSLLQEGVVMEPGEPTPAPLPRLRFIPPDRMGLPPLDRYASLQLPGGSQRTAGYTEASRGCKHLCRHCPVVPVYNGQFRIVEPGVVLADIRAQVEQGARHITFGDPDFFNGIGHALRVVDAISHNYPDLTYDVTIKIEHLLRHREHLNRLRETGCLFVTSAVESIDDRVLTILEKGHTCADFEQVAAECRAIGLTLSPTFVPFTPWTTLQGYGELLEAIEKLDLIEHVAPVQLAIRLLLPEGSRLLELDDVRQVVAPFAPETLAYPWTHSDPRVDALQQEVSALVGQRLNAPRGEVFDELAAMAHRYAGVERASRGDARPSGAHATVPSLSEAWYCCAEPTNEQLARI